MPWVKAGAQSPGVCQNWQKNGDGGGYYFKIKVFFASNSNAKAQFLNFSRILLVLCNWESENWPCQIKTKLHNHKGRARRKHKDRGSSGKPQGKHARLNARSRERNTHLYLSLPWLSFLLITAKYNRRAI